MRIVKYKKIEIKKEEFEEKLNMKIKAIDFEDDFIRLRKEKADPGDADASVLLLCEDIKDLFGVNYNMLDQNFEVKNNVVSYNEEVEVFRGKVAKWQSRFKKKMPELI